MNTELLWEHFYEFEFWSQLVIRSFYKQPKGFKQVVIKPTKFNIFSNVILLVGEIGVGKTIICELLSKKLGFNYVSTRKCVAKLIGMKDFGTKERSEFQKKADEFINSPTGPLDLANEILDKIDSRKENIAIVDGIRHLKTVKELKVLCPGLILIYVDTTRDDAFRNYKNRGSLNIKIHQFRHERFHHVEREIPSIKYEADAYIFNGGNKEELLNEFINWFNANRK
ncbi:MAG: AAA family ATPase [Nitrospinae bacterium]|nr:AAA family ATPase [Nitrospinota bacterium]